MKKILTPFLLGILCVAPNMANAANGEGLEKLKEKIVNSVEKRIEKTAEKHPEKIEKWAEGKGVVGKIAQKAGVDFGDMTDGVVTGSTGVNDDGDSKSKTKAKKKDKEPAAPRSEEEKALAQERISDLKDNAKALKDNRESAANKALTGAAIGTVGGGLMMTLQGSAEQKADQNAQDDMSAYISTFRCDYGKGQNIKGGETGVEIPGINALTKMFSEYATLAGELKARKESLGLAPGIESELVMDASNVGLYDDESLGITDSHYASWARAIMNPDSEDASELAAATKKSKTMKTAGIVMAAVGAAGSVVGNALINKDAPKNEADKINKDYDKQLKELKKSESQEACEKQAGKKWENGKCVDDPEYVKTQRQKECTAKGSDYEWKDDKCTNKKAECEKDAKKEWKSGQCVNKTITSEQKKSDEQQKKQETTNPKIAKPALAKRDTPSKPLVKDYELHEVP